MNFQVTKILSEKKRGLLQFLQSFDPSILKKMLHLTRPIVFFDLETTGTSVSKDRIMEIALVKLLPGGGRETKVQRINPQMPTTPGAFGVHGISDEEVADCPTFEAKAEELYDWLEGCDFGGYNLLNFDLPLLAEEFYRAGITPDFTDRYLVDPQQIFFKMERRTLGAALQFYCGKELENAHSAEADTVASIDVLMGQLKRYDNLDGEVEHLHKMCSNDEPLVDYARRLGTRKGEVVYNFGEHRGKTVREVLKKFPQYHDWVLAKDFPVHTKEKLREIVTALKNEN